MIIMIWDIETGKTSTELMGHKSPVYGVVFHPEGHLLATCAFDWTTILWVGGHLCSHITKDPRGKDQIIKTLEGHTDDIIGVDFDEGGNLLATGSDDMTASTPFA